MLSPVKLSMLCAYLCFRRFRPSFSVSFSLITAIENSVSNSTLIRCPFSPWYSTISITGRVPLAGFLGFLLDGVPALGSLLFRFREAPHTIVKASGCGSSRPLKNPIPSLPIMGPQRWSPSFRPPLLSVVSRWAFLPVPRIVFFSLRKLPMFSMVQVAEPCRTLC